VEYYRRSESPFPQANLGNFHHGLLRIDAKSGALHFVDENCQIRAVITGKAQWLRAMMLDPDTGLDPPGIRIRAAQGLDAASYFITGAVNLTREGHSSRH
jgi:hypothetical protein